MRKRFGFRSDLGYVRKLVKARRFAHEIGGVPVTRREDAYIRLRSGLDFGDAAYRYLRSRAAATPLDGRGVRVRG